MQTINTSDVSDTHWLLNVMPTSSSLHSVLWLSDQQLSCALSVHKNIIESFGLHLDDRIGDGIATKEFIHFSDDVDFIQAHHSIWQTDDVNTLWALNLWYYLRSGNPKELLGAFSNCFDQGVIFTDTFAKNYWYHARVQWEYRESTIHNLPLRIDIVDVISLKDFLRTYGYNPDYKNHVRQFLGDNTL